MSLVSVVLITLVAVSPGDAFDTIVEWAKDVPRKEAAAKMAAWWEQNPTDPRAGRAVIWIAQLHLTDGRVDDARRWFERAESNYRDSEWGLHGIKGRAGLDAADWKFERALEAYGKLVASGDPFFVYEGEMGLEIVRRLRRQIFGVMILGVLILAVGGLRLWRAGLERCLWPPPLEFTGAIPILGLVAFGAIAQPHKEASALVMLALGGGALLWLNGALLRKNPPSPLGRIGHAVWGVVQGGALLYIVVVLFNLWDKVRDTLIMGADA
jgi:hypothetical protein